MAVDTSTAIFIVSFTKPFQRLIQQQIFKKNMFLFFNAVFCNTAF